MARDVASEELFPRVKSWNINNEIVDITNAETSYDGQFIAISASDKKLCVVALNNIYEEVVFNDMINFSWGRCNWKAEVTLSYPTEVNFLSILDSSYNIRIFSINKDENNTCKSVLYVLIDSTALFTEHQKVPLKDFQLITTLYNTFGTEHELFCLVNRTQLFRLQIPASKKAAIQHDICLCEQKVDGLGQQCEVFLHAFHKDMLFFITNDKILIIVFCVDFQQLKKFKLYDMCITNDILHFDVFGSDTISVAIVDEHHNIHITNIFDMQIVQKNVGLSSQRSVSHWKQRLKKTKARLKSSINLNFELDTKVIQSPNWLHDSRITTFYAANQSLFFIYETNSKCNEERFIGKYDFSTDELEVKEIPFNVCLCGSSTAHIPIFFISPSLITVELFNVTQEQLIDTIIQHSDIAQAELICKSNKWNQFSIPLHTLEVGLQHRQLDTIVFFLKSREKVFTRYWRSYCEQSTCSNASSPPKSVGSQKSLTELVGSDEMFDVIEMLINGCSYNSKEKHHQNFFDGLLNVTLKFCNSLLQDGLTALEIKVSVESENKFQRSASHFSTNGSFSFLYDITETLKYITEKIIELRLHLKMPVLTNDSVDGECKTVVSHLNFEELAVKHLLKGDIGSAQMLFYSQSSDQGGTLEDIVRFGRTAVMNQIKQQNIENAEKILLNLGLAPQAEIKKIYLTTVQRSLRAYLFDVLQKKDCLSQQEIIDYEFLKELEKIYDVDDFQIAMRRQNFRWNTDLKINLPLPLSFTNRESFEFSSTSVENQEGDGSIAGSCYCELSLLDVKSWDEKTRKTVLLDGVFIKDAQITLTKEYSDGLWTYLQSRGQLSILQFWIEEMDSKTRKQIFPPFPSAPTLNDEITTNYMKESLMNCLVNHGYYPENLMDNFPKFLKYISHNKLLFSSVHPMEHYKKQLAESERTNLICQFNTKFLEFCQENDLLLLAYHFMSYYRITPSDVQWSDKTKSWFAMMMHFHHVALQTSSNEVNGNLLNALLMNSCYLNQSHITKDGNYTLNDVVKDKQPVTALAIALIANLDIDTVLDGKEDVNVYSMEKTLLEHYLRYYPKLHQILFKQSTASHNDISMYELLEDNTEINISKYFTWQSMNNLALKDDYILQDLPHFSHPILVERYANEITLEYDYYLCQGRPFFAYLVYLNKYKQYMKRNYTIATVLNDAYRLAIENFTSSSITLSCALFAELIEQNCEKIKIDTKVALFIKNNYLKRVLHEKKNSPRDLSKLIIDSFLNETDSTKPLMYLLKLLEDSTEVIIHENKLNRYSYEAVCQWQLAIRFCRLHQLPLSTRYMENCCHEENWLQLFLFIHFYQIPCDQVVTVLNCTMKNRKLKEHLLTIIINTKEVQFVSSDAKRKRKKSKDTRSKEIRALEKAAPRDIRAQFYSKLGTVTTEHIHQSSTSSKYQQVVTNETTEDNPGSDVTQDPTVSELNKIPDDIIDIMLISSNHPQPAKMLCLYAIITYQPLLPVFAACYEKTNLTTCLCLWYICSINDDDRLDLCRLLFDLQISNEDLTLALQNHQWQSSDLLSIVKFMLTKRFKYAKLITQGFLIFKQNDLLTHLLQALESHLLLKPTAQTAKLMERFQTEHQSYRSGKVIGKFSAESVDIYHCEHFAYQSIMTIIDTSPSQYDVYQFTKPLSESKFGYTFSIKVPDFVMIKKTADIVYHTNIAYNIKSLYSVGPVNEEINKIFDLLLDGAHFEDANDLAALHNLDTSKILSKKAFHEVDLISKTTPWKTAEVRSGYWRKINDMLLENNCDPRIGGDFFKHQAMSEPSSFLAGERAALLLVALHWYHKENVTDAEKQQFAEIEKEIWMFRIKAQLENKNGMCIPNFNLCLDKPVGSLETERTFSETAPTDDLVELLQSEELAYTFQGNDVPNLNEQEENALEELIGVLLDDNCVTEARRLARYFNKTSLDLDIVMTAILIAQNKRSVETLNDDIKQILAETTSRHISISGMLERSGSFSRPGSLSSNPTGVSGCMVDFVFIEEVQNALEKLTLRVNHGKQSCQRVLVSFKIAKVLCTSYEDIVSDDTFLVLRKLLETNFDQRRTLAKQFIKAFGLSSEQISTFVGETMIYYIKMLAGELSSETRSLLPPSFEEITSMVQFTDNSSLVATMILDEAVRVSKSAEAINRPASNLAYEVELFVFSHFCFTMSCNMEGIASVLRTARISAKTLAKINQHSLMVRLLTGIGRFREMMYIIETLYNQHHFEILCRKGFSNENQLKIALLDFMKKFHPDDMDTFNLISVGFGMYREFAQHLESTGCRQIEEIKNHLKTQCKDLVPGLEAIRRTFSYAADNYVKDDCLTPAQRCIRVARLIKLQIELLPTGAVLLGLTQKEVEHFISSHLSFIESFIMVDSYEIREPSIWVEPLYQIVIVRSHFSYLQQFQSFIQLNASLVTEVALRFRNDKNTVSTSNMKKFLNKFPDIKTKLRISKELNFSDVEKQLLEGSTGAYLRDNLF